MYFFCTFIGKNKFTHLIVSFTLSVEKGWKLKEEVFFDFTMSLIFVILGYTDIPLH